MGLSAHRKSVISGFVYGVASVISGSFGIVALLNSLVLAGIALLVFGVLGFGWACLGREEFFK